MDGRIITVHGNIFGTLLVRERCNLLHATLVL
jgi:hypothetical protein